jgi:hypothetical protein
METPSNVSLNLDTLYHTFLILKQRWLLSDLQNARDIPFLFHNITQVIDKDIVIYK